MNVFLVCGGRDFRNRQLLFDTLDSKEVSCIVHGGAEGADSLAGEWAVSRKVPEIVIMAQWKGYGNSAGVIRNQWMLKFTKVTHVIAFPGGRGTANMIMLSEKALKDGLITNLEILSL